MKQNLSSFICIILIFFNFNLLAGEIHAIIFADTKDSKIGSTCLSDYKKMSNEFDAISGYTGMELNTYYYKGSQFTKKNLQKVINDLSVSSDDLVYFYYSGHGFRYDNQYKKWPRLALGFEGQGLKQRDTDMAWIKAKIENKGARLNIFIADCCNNPIGISLPANPAFDEETTLVKKNYITLFKYSKGTIIASGCKPGQYSYCNDKYGGYFTYFLLKAIHTSVNETMDAESAWRNILAEAKKGTSNFTDAKQIPQYSIDAIADPFDD